MNMIPAYRRLKLFGLPVFLCIILRPSYTQGQPEFARQAFRQTLELKLDSAKWICEQNRESANAEIAAWSAYLLDYQAFFRYFISENEVYAGQLSTIRSAAFDFINKLPDTSRWKNYLKAELNLRSSLVNFKLGNYSTGAQALKRCYNLLEENIRKYPDFPYHYRSYGAVEALLGTVPDNYKWITNALGLKGNIEAGLQKVENALNRVVVSDYDRLFVRETLFLFTFLKINIAYDADGAWSRVEPQTADYRNNLLNCYLRGVTALKSGRNDIAIETLNARPTRMEYFPFAYLDYLQGLAYLRKLEPLKSRELLNRFMEKFEGPNHRKDAIQKLAWGYLIQGNVKAYQNEMNRLLNTGVKRLEDDKQAQMEAEKGRLPHVSLLKMRLLFDGGYYSQCLEIAGNINVSGLALSQQAEFYYRRGRALQLIRHFEEALGDYERTLEIGKDLPEYYAASAALQSGYIYRDKGQKSKAKEYFEKVAQCKNEEYKDGLRQKAKAALKQLK